MMRRIYTIDRTAYPRHAEMADRIRNLVDDDTAVEVTDHDQLLFRVDAGADLYWLRDAKLRTIGTFADPVVLVTFAQRLEANS